MFGRLEAIFSQRYLLVISIFILTVSLINYPIQSDDLFMYLAVARKYFESGSFPTVDPFLYTTTDVPWTILHQWLGYLAFYSVYALGGFNLIVILKTVMIAATLLIPILFTKRPLEWLIWSLSVILALFGISFRLMERTSLFSDIFIVLVLLILLTEHQRPSKLKYYLPLIFLFWVNMHPAFPVGWILCGLFLVFHLRSYKTKAFQHFFCMTIFSVVICFVNPKGVQGFLYPFNFAHQEAQVFRQYYFEWFPTLDPMYRFQMHTLFLGLLILLNLGLLGLVRTARPFFETALSLVLISYGLYAIRFVPTLGFGLVVLNTFISLKLKDFRWIKPVSFLVALLALSLGLKNMIYGYETISGPRQFGLGLDPRVIPEKAAQFILQYPQIGNVYNSHMFGSYLAWAWNDSRKIFYHGFVTDLNLFLNEYASFSKSPIVFEAQVEKYQIKAFLLDRFKGNERLVQILVQNPGWALAYQDESSLIFLPRAGLKD